MAPSIEWWLIQARMTSKTSVQHVRKEEFLHTAVAMHDAAAALDRESIGSWKAMKAREKAAAQWCQDECEDPETEVDPPVDPSPVDLPEMLPEALMQQAQ